MSRDILSDLLRAVRLRGAAFYYVSFRGHWSAGAAPAKEIAAQVMPGCDHVMEYHMFAKGTGWAAVTGLSPVRLNAGDIVLFPQGDQHVISSAPGLEPAKVDPGWLAEKSKLRRPLPVAFQEGVVDAGAIPVDSAAGSTMLRSLPTTPSERLSRGAPSSVASASSTSGICFRSPSSGRYVLLKNASCWLARRRM